MQNSDSKISEKDSSQLPDQEKKAEIIEKQPDDVKSDSSLTPPTEVSSSNQDAKKNPQKEESKKSLKDQVCFAFRDTGKCKEGSKCPRRHIQASE